MSILSVFPAGLKAAQAVFRKKCCFNLPVKLIHLSKKREFRNMNDFNPAGSSGSVSVSKLYGSFLFQVKEMSVNQPLLPNVFVTYKFNNAKHSIEIKGKKITLKFPKVNEILTEYCAECLPIYCTLSFFEMVKQQFPATFIPTFLNEKLESALSLYKKLYNATDTQSVYSVLSYYLSNPLDLSGLMDSASLDSKLRTLSDLLKATEEKYSKRLLDEVLPASATYENGKPLDPASIKWFNEKNSGKVLNAEAISFFIGRANSEMQTDIKVEFAKNQLKAIMFYADPVISDPRFRMSVEDPRWNEYDETIKKEVAYYNQKFAGVANYVPLDWRYVKAMVWTEVLAGPNERRGQWQQKPMQIGVQGDPGFGILQNGGENTDLIITPEFQSKLKQLAKWDGETNIKAGIAWLFRKACGDLVKINENKVDDPQILTHILDDKGFTGIEERLKTTIANIRTNNPEINFNKARVGQEIKYQKAHKERYISSWYDWRKAIFDYNGKGDAIYMQKIDNAYKIIISRDK